jgi:hypothetical protein
MTCSASSPPEMRMLMRAMTRRYLHTGSATVAIAAMVVAAASAKISFTSTFKSVDAGTVSFAGKKIAALVISDDESLRMAGEEALVRELSARGLQAVATYRIIPKEELRQAETVKPWFERANVQGLVAIRPVSAETRTVYTPSTWVNPSYGTLWGYYGYGWGSVYVPGSADKETVVVVESTVYSVLGNQLLWAAVTETSNPRNLQKFIEELVEETVDQMQKQGLAGRRR